MAEAVSIAPLDFLTLIVLFRREISAQINRKCTSRHKEGKYNKATHAARFALIRDNWDKIVAIINEEIPSAAEIEKILVTIGISPDVAQLELTSEDVKTTFMATKDIRDKYVLSRLAWDLGVMDELCALL